MCADNREKKDIGCGSSYHIIGKDGTVFPISKELYEEFKKGGILISGGHLQKWPPETVAEQEKLADSLAKKNDEGKLQYSLIPPIVLEELVKVFMAGNVKYVPNSWKEVVVREPNKYYDALIRHMEQWRSGIDKDSEDGLSHLSHAMCCAAILVWYNKCALLESSKGGTEEPKRMVPRYPEEEGGEGTQSPTLMGK